MSTASCAKRPAERIGVRCRWSSGPPFHGDLEHVAVAALERRVGNAGEVRSHVRPVDRLLACEPGAPRRGPAGAVHLSPVRAHPRPRLRRVAVDLERRRAAARHAVVRLVGVPERRQRVIDLVVANEPVTPLAPLEGGHAVVAARGDHAVVHQRARRGEAAVLEALREQQPDHVVGLVGHGPEWPVAAVVRGDPCRADRERAAREDALQRPPERGQSGGREPRSLEEHPAIDGGHPLPSPPPPKPAASIAALWRNPATAHRAV